MSFSPGSPMVIWAIVLLFEVMDKEISATKLAIILPLLGLHGFFACRKNVLFLPVFLLPGVASLLLLAEEFMNASVRDAILQKGGFSYPLICGIAIAGSLALPICGTVVGRRCRLETNGQ